MSNTAEIYKFPAPIPTQQECRMADLENGYLRLANQIRTPCVSLNYRGVSSVF